MENRSIMEASKSLVTCNVSVFAKKLVNEINLFEKIKNENSVINLEQITNEVNDFVEFSAEYKIYEMAVEKAEEIKVGYSVEFCDDGIEDYVEDVMLMILPTIKKEVREKIENAENILDMNKIYYIKEKSDCRTIVKNDCQRSLFNFGDLKEVGGGRLCLTL